MACYSATAIVVQPLVGAWVDRGGRRAFLVTGAVLTSGVAFLFAAAPDALGLFPLLRALQGVAFSVFFIANFTVVGRPGPAGPAQPGARDLRDLGARLRRRGSGARRAPGAGGRLSRPVPGLGGPPAPGRRDLGATPASRRTAPAAMRARACRACSAGSSRRPRLPMTLGAAFGLGQGVMFTFFPTYALDLGVRWVGALRGRLLGAALGVRATASGLADTTGRRAVIIPAMMLQAGATVLLAEPRSARAGRGPPGRTAPRPRRCPCGCGARTPLPGAHGARRRCDPAGAPRPRRSACSWPSSCSGQAGGRRGLRPPRPRGRLWPDVRHPEHPPRRGVRPRVPPGALTRAGVLAPLPEAAGGCRVARRRRAGSGRRAPAGRVREGAGHAGSAGVGRWPWWRWRGS